MEGSIPCSLSNAAKIASSESPYLEVSVDGVTLFNPFALSSFTMSSMLADLPSTSAIFVDSLELLEAKASKMFRGAAFVVCGDFVVVLSLSIASAKICTTTTRTTEN